MCLTHKRSSGDVRRPAIGAGTKPGHTACAVTPAPVSRYSNTGGFFGQQNATHSPLLRGPLMKSPLNKTAISIALTPTRRSDRE